MNALLSLISSMHEQSQQLVACLLQEKEALDKQQYDALTTLAPEKQLIIDALHALEQKCMTACSTTNINDFIKVSDDTSLITIWNSTQKLLKDCRKQNNVNGVLINRHSLINKDMLTILTGNQQSSGQTYNAKGNQVSSNSILNNIEA